MQNNNYYSVDMPRTGLRLKTMLKSAGYEVKGIQQYLHLSCPQSIYRWLKGKALPSVEHLCALSILLGVHMEDLLVLQNQQMDFSKNYNANYNMVLTKDSGRAKRLLCYFEHMSKAA